MVASALEVLPGVCADFEIIIVDDGSQDATEAEGKELAASHPAVRYVRHDVNRGYGEALRTGLTAASKEAIVYIDGDQQFDLRELPAIWQLLIGADVVAGFRAKRADPFHRLVIAWVYNHLIRVLFGLRVHDVDCAFKVLRAEVVEAVRPRSGGAFFSAEFLLRARHQGFRVVEVPVSHYPRLLGRPKGATPAVILRTLREMLALRLVLRRGLAGPADRPASGAPSPPGGKIPRL